MEPLSHEPCNFRDLVVADLRRATRLLIKVQGAIDWQFRLATPEMMQMLMVAANADARLLVDQDRGLQTARGQAARTALYLFERDAAVALLRSG